MSTSKSPAAASRIAAALGPAVAGGFRAAAGRRRDRGRAGRHAL